MKRTIRIVCIVLLIIMVWLAAGVYNKLQRPPAGFSGKIIHIPAGASVHRIGEILEKEKIIRRADYFYLSYRLFFRNKTMKSGEYSFDRPMTVKEILRKLIEGRVVLKRITFKEGINIKEMARILQDSQLISSRDFLAATKNVSRIRDMDPQAQDLEGYLFPDTYLFRRGTSAEELVENMVANFKAHFQKTLIWRCRQVGFTIPQALTLASLIEKETSDPEERFKISSVFHNRLERHMLLDCDPTVVYALERDNRYRGKLGWDDLKYDSPYNTRLHRGLPPGPICNPGIASIEGALYPMETNYLYFVSMDGRNHYFSESLAEHNWAVRKFILQHNARLR